MVNEALQQVPNYTGDKDLEKVNQICESLAFMGENSTTFSLPQKTNHDDLPCVQVKQAYAAQIVKQPSVCWYRWTWNTWNIPKFNVICWLLCKGRLQTRDRLHNLGICTTTICPVCFNAQETIPHLFFECIFSRKCLKYWYDWLATDFRQRNVIQCIRWIKRQRHMNHKKKRLAAALLAAVTYIIWTNRNRCAWELSSNNPDRVMHRAFLQVMHRMHMLSK